MEGQNARANLPRGIYLESKPLPLLKKDSRY